MKKYEFTGETKVVLGVTLKQIVCVAAFASVSVGDVGGWIESEANLDQYGDAWVSGDARVSGNAEVSGDARVSGNARVSGDVRVSGDARVYGNAEVSGDAWVSGDARVSGDAWVYGNAEVSGDAWVSGDARVSGNAEVSGDARVYGNARVSGDVRVLKRSHCVWFSNVGSENGTLTVAKSKNGGLFVSRGCFSGTTKEFKEAVSKTHSNSKTAKEYRLLIEFAELRMSED